MACEFKILKYTIGKTLHKNWSRLNNQVDDNLNNIIYQMRMMCKCVKVATTNK